MAARTRRDAPWPSPGHHQTVLLRPRGQDRLVPIHFGPGLAPGDILTLQLVQQTPTSALTYDLMARVLEAADANLERVTLSWTDSGVYYATLTLRAGGQEHVVEAGPGDALNLALRCGAPIMLADSLVERRSVPITGVFEALEADYRRGLGSRPLTETQAEWRSLVAPEWQGEAPVRAQGE